MKWIFEALFMTVPLFVVVSTTGDGNWECETKSNRWNEEIHQNLTSQCGDFRMSYDKQYCVEENTTLLHCMVERARMHDIKSCWCHRGQVRVHECYYAEVCAFVDPEFQCSNDYNCDADDEGRMTCFANGHPKYKNNCTRGLIYCPKLDCAVSAGDIHEFYQAECGSTYQRLFGHGNTVYYVYRGHFNGSDYIYGNVYALPQEGDQNLCEKVDLEEPMSDWILLAIIFFSLLLVVSLLVYVWRVRKRRAKEDERWKNVLSNTLDFLNKFMQRDSNSHETIEVTEVAEKVDPILPESQSNADEGELECLLNCETISNASLNARDGEDSQSTESANFCHTDTSEPDITEQRSLIEHFPLRDMKDDNVSPEIPFPVDSDSGESVFERDEPVSGDRLCQGGVDETSTSSNHDSMVNVYENSTYGQVSFSSGYIPKSFDFDDDT